MDYLYILKQLNPHILKTEVVNNITWFLSILSSTLHALTNPLQDKLKKTLITELMTRTNISQVRLKYVIIFIIGNNGNDFTKSELQSRIY